MATAAIQTVRRGRFGPTNTGKRDEVTRIEDVDDRPDDITKSSTARQFPFADESLSDEQLAFIPKELVLERSKQLKSKDQSSCDETRNQDDTEYWIVIDNIVFDCSDFASEHPGGESVFVSFLGEDCSWQFWRLHSKNVMEQYGRALRIGRTEGVKNRFAETAKYVGLSKLGNDGW